MTKSEAGCLIFGIISTIALVVAFYGTIAWAIVQVVSWLVTK